jgi:hypothetical protein
VRKSCGNGVAPGDRDRAMGNEYCCSLDTALDPLRNNAQYVENPTNRCAGPVRPRTPHGETKMTTMRGSARYAGLLPVDPSDEPSPIRPTILENERLPNGQPSFRKRAALRRFAVTFCAGAAVALACWSYGDAARHKIASSYPQLGWLVPRGATTAQKTSEMVAPTASAAPFRDQQELEEVVRDLDAMRQSIERIAASQEQITRSIDQIATSQELTRSTDESASGTAEAPAADATHIAAGRRADGASLQATERFDIKPTDAKPPERGKELSAASRHDVSCFPSASAVLQNHPGGWPSWTLKAPGHEGTLCWYAAARPRGSDHRPVTSEHRSEPTPGKEMLGTTESTLSAPPAYSRPPQ